VRVLRRARGTHCQLAEYWDSNWRLVRCTVSWFVLSHTGLAMINHIRTADFLGRRYAIVSECVVFIIGVIIQLCSFHVWQQFAVGRFVSGLGVGALSAAVPMVSDHSYAFH
jgi:MFS family permease